MVRNAFLYLCLLCLGTINLADAQVAARQDSAASAANNQSGTWTATTGNGLPLRGTWTAVFEPTSRTVTGGWVALDQQGSTLAQGGWSASKSGTQWIGAWRAAMAGRNGEYSGTWSTGVDLKGDGTFLDLFEKAAQAVVSGVWRSGNLSGPWAIRAAKLEPRP